MKRGPGLLNRDIVRMRACFERSGNGGIDWGVDCCVAAGVSLRVAAAVVRRAGGCDFVARRFNWRQRGLGGNAWMQVDPQIVVVDEVVGQWLTSLRARRG